MDIPPVSDAGRLIVWVLVGIATAVNVFLGNIYEENIGFQLRRFAKRPTQEAPPEPVPWGFKVLSVVFITVMVVGTAYASSAPPLVMGDSQADTLAVIEAILERTNGGDQSQQAPATVDETAAGEGVEEAAEEATPTEEPVDPGQVPLSLLGTWLWRGQTPTADPSANPDLDNFSSIVAVSPPDEGGASFIAASFPDGYMSLFEVDNSFELIQLGEFIGNGYTRRAQDLAFSPDGTLLLSGGLDGELSAWGYSSSGILVVPQASYQMDAGINALALSTDGQVVASGLAHAASASENDDSQVFFSEVAGGSLEQAMPLMNTNQQAIYDLAFTLDERLITVGNFTHISWFEHRENPSRMVFQGDLTLRASWYRAVAASPNDANLFYTSNPDGRVVQVSLESEEILNLSAVLEGEVLSLAYHPSLDLLAVGTAECTVYLLDANNLSTIATAEELCTEFDFNASRDIGSLAFSPQGDYLAAGHAYGFVLLNIPLEVLGE